MAEPTSSFVEAEFLAEMESIDITPNFKAGVLRFITVFLSCSPPLSDLLQGEVGPFKVQMPVTVPLWLAVALKRRSKCSIRPPIWLTKGSSAVGMLLTSAESLIAKKDQEKTEDTFTEMPPFYQEIARILFEKYNVSQHLQDIHPSSALDNIPDAAEVRNLLQDVQDLRDSKVQKGLLDLKVCVVDNRLFLCFVGLYCKVSVVGVYLWCRRQRQ